MDDMIKDAIIDPTGQFRYSLWRTWNPDRPKVLFVMLNPSKADANVDDPTIRRCIGFAKGWGFGSLEVVNLFAYRATNPDELKNCSDPIGPDNDAYIRRGALRSEKIVTAWGTKGGLFGRDRSVMETILHLFHTYCLEISKDGDPKHPLYIASDCAPVRYNWKLTQTNRQLSVTGTIRPT